MLLMGHLLSGHVCFWTGGPSVLPPPLEDEICPPPSPPGRKKQAPPLKYFLPLLRLMCDKNFKLKSADLSYLLVVYT